MERENAGLQIGLPALGMAYLLGTARWPQRGVWSRLSTALEHSTLRQTCCEGP